ncbi:hypothetical protein PhCBS80983_g02057 [Powellomyces hirtus]|uniref:Proteasome assembly chaperone 2 n=1 Tax=Powellomyces hirtus TaxID=109895 RepID=A0A507EAC1_9FUNG|nr:hypothetical protein PhCBS80983_g02057 [Powellomyces hirtus]
MTILNMRFHPIPDYDANELSGKTLVMPAPNALGNLGQLAVDVLISSLSLRRVGFVSSDLVLPVCGTEVYGTEETPNTLHTSFEVYASLPDASPQLVVVQLRAPVISRKGLLFSSQFQEWVEHHKFSDVILVTGVDAGRRNDREIISQLGVLESPNGHFNISELGFLNIESRNSDSKCPVPPPGAGLSRFIIEELHRRGLPVLVVACFASEGDHTQATRLASAVYSIVHPVQDQITWKTPLSWSQLYGNAQFTKELFQ